MRSRLALLAAAVLTLAVAAPARANVLPSPGPLSPVPLDTWDANGPVQAAAASGGRLFLGGAFTYLAPARTGAGLARLDATTGVGHTDVPAADGPVEALLADGNGGWYVGGRFSSLGGRFCPHLAHVRADGTIDTDFCPNPESTTPNGIRSLATVQALVRSGSTLYVGGVFDRVRGVDRANLAAVNATTGALIAAFAPPATRLDIRAVVPSISNSTLSAFTSSRAGSVLTLAIVSRLVSAPLGVGTQNLFLVAGGDFTHVGTAQRLGFATFDLASGALGSLAPRFTRLVDLDSTAAVNEVEFPEVVRALRYAISIPTTASRLYVGGTFERVDGQSRRGAAALLEQGGLTSFNPAIGGDVRALAVAGGRVYLGGAFGLAAVSPQGTLLPWAPNPDGAVSALAIAGETVFAAGSFSTFAGQPRAGVAAVRRADLDPVAAATPFDAHPIRAGSSGGPLLMALAAQGADVLLGGAFSRAGGVERRGLASIDLATGAPDAWQPVGLPTSCSPAALVRDGTTLYAGCATTNVVALRTDTGAAVPGFQPGPLPVGALRTLAVRSGTLYVGQLPNGVPRGTTTSAAVFALDAATGAARPWAPPLSTTFSAAEVTSIVPLADRVLVGGTFTTIAGVSRTSLAALDPATGEALPFDAALTHSPQVVALGARAVAAGGIQVYIAGSFVNVGGAVRTGGVTSAGLASVDAATGAVTPWNPHPHGIAVLRGMLLSTPDVILAGPQFNTGGDHVYLVDSDPPGARRDFDVVVDRNTITGLAFGPGSSVVVFGTFGTVAGQARTGFAVLPRVPLPTVGQSGAAVGRTGVWRAPVTCPRRAVGFCEIHAVLREEATRRHAIIGTADARLRPGQGRRLRFPITPAGLRLLGARRSVVVAIEVTSESALGRVATATRRFTLHLA